MMLKPSLYLDESMTTAAEEFVWVQGQFNISNAMHSEQNRFQLPKAAIFISGLILNDDFTLKGTLEECYLSIYVCSLYNGRNKNLYGKNRIFCDDFFGSCAS